MSEFEKILDEDEFIIKEYRPNKFKFYFQTVLITSFILLFMFIPVLIGVTVDPDAPLLVLPIVLTLFIIIILIVLLLTKLSYNKRFYAYTNKRIIIQNGFIGIDFKSLDLEFIGATEVRVDFLDKLLKRNTGTIKFGSHATPTNVQGVQAFQFVGILDPYNVYKEIKKHMDEVKSNISK